jgi:hypothetical protein
MPYQEFILPGQVQKEAGVAAIGSRDQGGAQVAFPLPLRLRVSSWKGQAPEEYPSDAYLDETPHGATMYTDLTGRASQVVERKGKSS